MKYLLVFSFLFSLSVFSAPIVLDSKQVSLGNIGELTGTAQFSLIRNAKTPIRTVVTYEMKVMQPVCTRFVEQIFTCSSKVGGWYTCDYHGNCRFDGSRDGNVCMYRKCVSWEDKLVDKQMKLKLSFRGALELVNAEREKIDITVKKLGDGEVKYEAIVKQWTDFYEIIVKKNKIKIRVM